MSNDQDVSRFVPFVEVLLDEAFCRFFSQSACSFKTDLAASTGMSIPMDATQKALHTGPKFYHKKVSLIYLFNNIICDCSYENQA